MGIIMVLVSNAGLIGSMGGFGGTAPKNLCEETMKLAKDAVALAKRLPDASLQGPTLYWQAQVFAMSQSSEAHTTVLAALAQFRKDGFRNGEGQALTLSAQIHFATGEDERALQV